jgi:hypothetical protein
MLPEWLDALIWFQLLPELEPLPPSAAQTDLGITARRDETPLWTGRADGSMVGGFGQAACSFDAIWRR